jgi:hypothetical protein
LASHQSLLSQVESALSSVPTLDDVRDLIDRIDAAKATTKSA